MPHRNRTERVAALQQGIESANELLIPVLDLPGDTPETLARRARIQARAADERSRQALAMATDVKNDSWTKEQHRVFSRETHQAWQRMERRFYILLITTTVALGAIILVAYNVWVDQAAERREIEAHVADLAAAMVISCQTRNEQLATSREVYGYLARSLERDPANAEAVMVLRDAQEGSPEPVDCARYEVLAGQP